MCSLSYDYHEISFDTKKPFLCKCPITDDVFGHHWSKFLDNDCENGHYKPKS